MTNFCNFRTKQAEKNYEYESLLMVIEILKNDYVSAKNENFFSYIIQCQVQLSKYQYFVKLIDKICQTSKITRSIKA